MNKYLRFAHILFSWKVQQELYSHSLPEEIFMEITNDCNFKCSYCPHADANHFKFLKHSALKPDDALLILQKLRNGGVKTKDIHLNIDGEPFINKYISEICLVAINLGWSTFNFATNGYYVTLERVRKLPAEPSQVNYVFTIDFCSDEMLFERCRGWPGSWLVVKSNLLDLLNANLPYVSIVITDISSYSISDKGELQARYSALKKLFPSSRRLSFKTRKFHDVTAYVSGQAVNEDHESDTYHTCPYPWTSLHVASNGDVISCDRDLRHQNVLGNLFLQDFAEIWNGERYMALRRAIITSDLGDMGACTYCDLPYDSNKFSFQHLLQVAIVRLGLFSQLNLFH
ncbi:MAG TPA: radical SAM protein [Chlorobium sp.]|uniref:Radical SAM domain protein n=1 Tax=Chlorobium phaeovibrioides (strain DSM 265 / 1930) TaxID=290318 RepID=A4SF21_CHLPM|nr:radical SAM protein [Chlorobium sp.]